ncbi:putative viral replication protein, partial [Mitosporidium daphniae]
THPDGCPEIHNGCVGYPSVERELDARLVLGRIWTRLCSDKALAIKFGRGQLERTTTNQFIHIQGYVIMQTRKRFPGILKIIRGIEDVGGVTISTCKGTHGQNVAYVTKSDTRVDPLDPFGDDVTGEELSKGGSVGKIARLIEVATGPGGINGALEELPVTGMQNIRNLQTFLHFTQKPHVGVRFNIFISGPPRCGKSRFAWSLLGLPYVKGAGKWFDGYSGEKTALFDECQTLGRITDLVLKITDRYPARVEVKGGSVWFNAVVNVFTSNLSFRDALCTDKESFDVIGAIEDRFALILNVSCDRLGKPVVKLLDYIKNPTAPALIIWKGASIAIDDVHASSRFPVSDLLQCMVTAGVFTEELVSSADPPIGDLSLEPDSRE